MNYFNEVPEKVKSHLKNITKTSGLEQCEESVELIAENWIDKDRHFTEQIEAVGMKFVNSFNIDDKRGFILLTYSGSLISVSPQIDGKRYLEYASIKLRHDVPDIIDACDIELSNNIHVDMIAEFKNSPVKKSSALFKIAVCNTDVPLDEQDKRIREATIFITNGFIKINRTFAKINGESPDHFTSKSIITYVAKRNGITKKKMKQIIDDYTLMLETGLIMGESVPVGRLGKIHLQKRAPQKARIMKGFDGKDITVPAKPETTIPKMKFSTYLKDRVKDVDV